MAERTALASREESSSELRPKPLSRRLTVAWTAADGIWKASIGSWSAAVAPCYDAPTMWEWRAFATGDEGAHALGARAWRDREEAQRDAESILATAAQVTAQ